MRIVQGDYGDVIWLEQHLVELVPKRALELTAEELDSIYDSVIRESGGYCALLVNRVYEYSLTYAANRQIAAHSGLLAIAYLAHTDAAALVSEYSVTMARSACCPIRVFRQRDNALSWLREQLALHGQNTRENGTT